MVHREVVDTTLDASGVLWFKGRLYVPQVGNLIHDVPSKPIVHVILFILPRPSCTATLGNFIGGRG